MPLPKPRSGEEHDAFLARCHAALAGEFPDESQRNAVCESQWGTKSTEETSMKTEKPPITRHVFPFQVKAAIDPSTGARTFEGLAAVWDLDLGNDIIHKGAFTEWIKSWKGSGESLPLLNSHDHWDIMSALGQAIDVKETKDGLWTKWEVIDGPEGDAALARLRPSVTTGRAVVGKMSIGFEPVEWSFEQPQGAQPWESIRHLMKINLAEVSLVLFPMAPGASIDATSVKSFLASAQATDPKRLSPDIKQELRRLNTRIGQLLKKQEAPSAEEPNPPVDEPPVETPPPETPPDTKGAPPVETPPVEVSPPEPTTPKEPEAKADGTAYQFSEALQQRLQATLLRNKVSGLRSW